MRLADIWNKETTCIIHTSTQEEADMLLKTTDSFVYNGAIWASWWDRHKEKTCYRINLGEVVAYGCMDDCIENGEKVIEFSDLFETSSAYNFTAPYLDLSVFNKEVPEPVVPTLAEIKEKELTCCINVRSIAEAQFLDDFFECKSYLRKYCENAYKERMRLGYYRTLEDGVAFQLTDGVINDNCSANFYRCCGSRYGEVYEFSDLFPVGSTMVCGYCVYKRTDSREFEEKLNKELAEHFNAFSNDGILAKNGGENSMKFTFYVKEGTRPDKKCNGTIPTITTNIELFDGDIFDEVTIIRGSATCDKADYDERQGVLEALANAVCGGEFEKSYKKAVKANKDADLWLRTCLYCGKVCDTKEEKTEHEKWHVERKKARRERYLLRKRAKEIAFEEQAQKMAKEMMGEQK